MFVTSYVTSSVKEEQNGELWMPYRPPSFLCFVIQEMINAVVLILRENNKIGTIFIVVVTKLKEFY